MVLDTLNKFKGTYLLVKEAVQDEDEHSLHAVDHGKDVGHDNCFLLEVQHAKYPSTSQEAELSNSGEGKDPKTRSKRS